MRFSMLAHATGRGPCLVTLLLLIIVRHVSGQDSAQTPTSDIRDSAKMFSPDAVRQAKETLLKAERSSRVPVVIRTIESLEGEAIGDAGVRLAKQSAGHGVFLLIAKDEKKIAGPLMQHEFLGRLPEAKRDAIRDAFLAEFKKGDYDSGLRMGADAIAEALVGSAPASSAKRGGAHLVVRNQVRLTLAGARRVLEAAEAKAAEMNLKMNIAVVDDGGHLIAFARMDGARPASAATATTKAITAATFRQATGPLPPGAATPDVLLNISLQNAASASGGKITTLLGGVPIVVDGQVIGAVGVGGGSGEQDAEIGKAGAAALLEDLRKHE